MDFYLDEPSTISLVDPIFSAQLKPTIQLLETPVVYKPTPKILLASTVPDSPEPAKKKQRIEYVPTPKPIGRDLNEKEPTKTTYRTAEYTPTSAVVRQEPPPEIQPNNEVEFNLDECLDELDAIADMLQSGELNADEGIVEPEPKTAYVPSQIPKNDIIEEVKGKSSSKEKTDVIKNGTTSSNGKSKTHDNRSSSKSSRSGSSSSSHREHISNRHRDSSHKSSSSSKDKDRSSKDKDRSSKDKDRVKETSSSRPSKSSSSSSRHTSSKPKDESTKTSSKSLSSDSSRSHKSTTKSSDRKSSDKGHSSQSTSRSDSSKSAKPSTDPQPPPSLIELTMPSPSSVFDSESDEDDVMAQCRLIFDEYKTKIASTAVTTEKDTSKKVSPEVEQTAATATKYDDSARKKRVAYDGAENGRPVSGAPTTLAKNYSHMAMEVSLLKTKIVLNWKLFSEITDIYFS